MADKYLSIGAVGAQEVEATDTSTGASEAGDIVALDSTGKLDASLFPAGIGQNVSVLPSGENLAAGDWVNIYDDGGTATVRKADNSNGRRANGFVLAGVTSPANATVYGIGELNDQMSSLTIGATYYLGTSGAETSTLPTGAGVYAQILGVAESATAIRFSNIFTIVRA